jgi:hypothetical protein
VVERGLVGGWRVEFVGKKIQDGRFSGGKPGLDKIIEVRVVNAGGCETKTLIRVMGHHDSQVLEILIVVQ